MNTVKDYYKVLGVDKTAGDKDIKRAYRKLALQFHPDKSKAPDAEEKFKAINEAYGALIDRSKREANQSSRGQVYRPTRPETSEHQGRYKFSAFRRRYDPDSTYQHTPGFGGTFQQEYCPDSTFQQTSGPGRPFEQSFGSGGTFKETFRTGDSFQHTFGFSWGTFQATFSFGDEAGVSYNYSGTTSGCTFTASQSRPTAHVFGNTASGLSQDDNPQSSAGPSASRKCSYTKAVSTLYREIFVTLEEVLHGCSKTLKIAWNVEAPGGQSVRRGEKTVVMTLEPGVISGTKRMFQCPEVLTSAYSSAAIVFMIRDKKHPLFKRDGADILYVVHLSPWEAQWSTRIDVPTLTMEKISLPLEGPVQSGTIKRIIGQGLPYHGAPKKRGDLLVRFQVDSATP